MLGLDQIVLITEDSDIQPIGSKFELESLSINIPKSYTIWLGNFNDNFLTLISNSNIKIKSNHKNLIYDIDSDSNVLTTDAITYTTNGIQILFESDTQSIQETIITVSNDSEFLFSFYLEQTYIDLQDRIYIAANNYGIQINEDWNKAFIETDIHEINPDYTIHNRKLSEFLLHTFELVGLRGSYKTFTTAINYFGYKDILWFEETWLNKDNQKRLTEINNQIIDEHFARDGYKKIGELVMFYSLDIPDVIEPFDEGGLPQYEYRNISYYDLYTKLVLLRKILQKWFLPYNVYITDIIGEFHGVAGLQKKIWTAEDYFLNINEHKRFDFMDIVWEGTHKNFRDDSDDNEYVFITEHKIIANTNLFSILPDETLQLNTSKSAHINEPLIQIEKMDDEIKDLNDFDILTKFFVQDIGVLNQNITLYSDNIPDYIFGFKLRLVKLIPNTQDYEVIFLSKLLPVSEIFNITRLGIRELGDFEISITAFDKYGYSKSWSKKFSIMEDNILLDFLLLRPKYLLDDENNTNIKRYLQFETVQETRNSLGIPIIDAIDYNLWNINNPNRIEVGTKIARRYYHPGEPIESPIIKNKRNLIISKLNKMPISENWNPFNISFIKLLHDEKFSISLKIFEHQEYETVEYTNDAEFLNNLTELSKNPDSVFNLFDFDIQMLNDVYQKRLQSDEMDKSFPVLVLFNKIKAFDLQTIIFKFEIDDEIYTNDITEEGDFVNLITEEGDEDIIYYNKIYPSFGYDPMIRFNYMLPIEPSAISETMDYHIRLQIGNTKIVSEKEYGSPNPDSEPLFNFGNIKSILKNILSTELFESIEIHYSFNTFTIRHLYGDYIEFSHISLGHKLASKRDASVKKLYYTVAGSQFQIGSMIVIMPDENIKANVQDVRWVIRDSFSRLKFLTSDNYVCKWIPYRNGLYDVECIVIDKVTNSEISLNKRGCILVE